MKKKTFWAAMLIMAPVFTACTDIDVSDVNTNIEVPVDGISLPLKIDEFTLRSVLNVDDDNKIVETAQGEYALRVEGDFTSTPITIDPITIAAQNIEEVNGTISKSKVTGSSVKRSRRQLNDLGAIVAQYDLKSSTGQVSINSPEINEAIKKITNIDIATDFKFTIDIDKARALFDRLDRVHLENLILQIPAGFKGYLKLLNVGIDSKYVINPDGTVKLDNDITIAGNKLDIVVTLEGFYPEVWEEFNAARKKAGFSKKRAKGEADFTFEGEFGVKNGNVSVYENDFKEGQDKTDVDALFGSLTENLDYSYKATMDDVRIETFSGDFDYEVGDFGIEAIDLSDVPDLLRESGTEIKIDNPQLYLRLNNPLQDGANMTIPATTKLEMQSFSNNGTNSMHLDNGEVVKADKPMNVIYMSPRAVNSNEILKGYEGAEHVGFQALSELLLTNGNGVPNSISISNYDSHVKSDNVTDYSIGNGRTYVIEGQYTFLAPLALTENSTIKYSETVDGWYDDVKNIDVKKVEASANVTTDVPFDIDLIIKAIDEYGHVIAESTPFHVDANSKGKEAKLVLEGAINNFDGLKFDAVATAKSNNALRPDMHLKLDNLKVKLYGKYSDKF